MPERRVAITGLGVVAASGVGLEAFWSATAAGRGCIKRVDLFDPSHFPTQIGGQLDDFSARKFVPKHYRKQTKVMARDIEIAVGCGDLAVRDAGLTTRGVEGPDAPVPPKRLGCNIGAGLICADLDELASALVTSLTAGRFDFARWGAEGMTNLTPLWLLKYLPNMLSCHTTIIHGAEGPSNNITCGDASGHMSLGESASWIRRNAADVVIAGSAESKLNPMGLMRQTLVGRACISGNDSPATACRPFDTAHAGTAIGEGGGLMILEDLDRAEARGAKIYGELVSFAAASDPAGKDLKHPNCGGLQHALTWALRRANISPADLGLAVTHGTGVPGEDDSESAAWTTALAEGRDGKKLPALALTGAIGNCFAGASGVEAVAAVAALHHQTIPPTVNFNAPAIESCLDFHTTATPAELHYVAAGTFTVGGQSAVCLFKKYQP